ncbi:regulatory protein, gntR family, partial [Candidatus Kryptobacter tengchongensis]
MKKLIMLTTLLLNLAFSQTTRVKTGAEVFLERYLEIVKGKKIGIVTNHTGVLPDGRHIVDVLNSMQDVKVVALFGPEHGIRGEVPDGKSISHGVDTKTGIKVYSLYGEVKKPIPEMLKDIDILIFDIQDVGARFYTYISTMSYCMEACAELGKKFIVLDKPNPIRGVYIDGPVLEPKFRSFVGLHPIPVAHGMTVGELAKMFNVSRVVVREAISGLALLGIVQKKWGKGNYISDDINLSLIHNSIKHLVVLKEQEIMDVLEARMAVECELVSLAAKRRTEEDLFKLKTALDNYLKGTRGTLRKLELD